MLIVCPNLGDGGTQRVASTLANEWARRGKRIGFVTLYADDEAYKLEPGIVRFALHRRQEKRKLLSDELRARISPFVRWLYLDAIANRVLRWIRPSAAFFRVRSLRKVLRESGAPIVLAFIGSTNLIVLKACRGLGKRVIISERNDPARQMLKDPWNELRPRLYGQADVVTANSYGALDSMRSYVTAQKLAYVPNPLLRTETDERPEVRPQAGPGVLTVGRLHPQKAHDVLLEAFARLPEELADWGLTIVGRGDLESELHKAAARLGIEPRVLWAGQVVDPFPFYRASEIFALPSRHEGMPNALIEAMSCGMAVIISDASPGPLELVRHEENGLVIPVDDPSALSCAIERLACDLSLRKQLGESARLSAQRFELPQALAAWEKVVGL